MTVEVYTKDDCAYCTMAKAEFAKRGMQFEEYKLHQHFTRDEILEKFPGAKTFPIIVLDGTMIGGYTQLKEHFASNPN